ncbi:MAG: hypothetical protein IJQ68_04225 [Methanobrevibacter sp.]|uniref:hypothetical protein n=1 Tax=Methanobrevibacter sp. TaxID=66852 RepID=UPI0025D9A3FD|nr:hypothetical protein [Methanobrevibacter sp.]MBR0271184.1 hypothetical protein [Methanobrevibacter sp.]
MSNFDFLKDFDTTLWKLGMRIEKQVSISPSGVKADATTFLEHILKQYLNSVNIPYNSRKNFSDQIDAVYRLDGIAYGFKEKIKTAYNMRSHIHDNFEEIEKNEYVVALQLHERLFYIAKKFYRDSDEYDQYRGVPEYRPLKLDFTDDEIELMEIPDFTEIVEFSYDYCVVCGEPNHSNYSIFCEKCNRDIENANNFISIRNSFGKDARFTKEDLIEYGIHEGYVAPLINSLVKSNLFKVKGRFIEFNNMNIDSYMSRIDSYIKIGELITKFREDKITPKEIKDTKQYRQGSFRQDPYYQFYKVINDEIISKFEKDLLTTENIWASIEYTTIPEKDLKRWYKINLNRYRKNDFNESFEIFNRLLIDDYLSLKRQGIKNSEIKRKLNISDEMLEFFPKFDPDFEEELSQIKKDLILNLLSKNYSKEQVIKEAGITRKEYDDLVKYSKFKKNEFGQEYEKIIKKRKEQLLSYLTNNDLKNSCKLTKITVDDFYRWFDEAKIDSDFYIKSNRILMDKYLSERKTGKTKSEACKAIYMDEAIVDKWLKRKNKLFDKFKDDNVKVIAELILKGFKKGMTKKQISDSVEVSVHEINTFLFLGKRGSKVYCELYQYYEGEVVPEQLSRFMEEIKRKPFNKALDSIDLTKDELNLCYESNADFHDEYMEFKKDKYVEEILSGRGHDTSLKRSNLSDDEYLQLKERIDEILLHERMEIVKREIRNDSKTDVAAKRAGVTFDDVYDWYYKGKSDEKFREFSEFFYSHYMEPNILWVNKLLRKNQSIEKILRIFDINFTEDDLKVWQDDGLITQENIVIDLTDKDNDNEGMSVLDAHGDKLYANENDDNTLLSDDKNSDLYEAMQKGDDKTDFFFNMKNPSKTSTILKKDGKEIEKLKKEMMGHKKD